MSLALRTSDVYSSVEPSTGPQRSTETVRILCRWLWQLITMTTLAVQIGLGLGAVLLATASVGCDAKGKSTPTIAFIPPSAQGLLWEIGRSGATVAADAVNSEISWCAPTSESDVTGQVALIELVGRRGYQGLVLAPNHPLAPMEPLRRILDQGIPVAVIATRLNIPASDKLGYVVNDDRKMGELAAAEIARLIGGDGPVAMIGLVVRLPAWWREHEELNSFLSRITRTLGL